MDVCLLSQLYTSNTATYLVFGREIGESGTPHLQGYLELSKRLRFSTLKKLLVGYHLEPRIGTAVEASDYCKKDEDFYEMGTISKPEQGRRTDLSEACEKIKSGISLKRLAEEAPEVFVKYHKGLGVLKNLLCPQYETTEHTERRFTIEPD